MKILYVMVISVVTVCLLCFYFIQWTKYYTLTVCLLLFIYWIAEARLKLLEFLFLKFVGHDARILKMSARTCHIKRTTLIFVNLITKQP